MSDTNPYAAFAPQSTYSAFKNNHLVHAVTGQAAGLRAIHIHHQMRAMIESAAFPCMGAKVAIGKNTYRFGLYSGMNNAEALAHDLFLFTQEQKRMPGDYTTFIACFDHAQPKDAKDFENWTWRLLGALATLDAAHHAWDPRASHDPENPEFSFSFAGTSCFVAALSPVSPRLSRQFVVPALVFNAHYQFEALRQKGLFDRLRDKIRTRDAALENGVKNDLADDFGGSSEAIQYCGIKPANGGKWRCPFKKYFHRPDRTDAPAPGNR